MPVKYQNENIKKMYLNGQEITQAYFNGDKFLSNVVNLFNTANVNTIWGSNDDVTMTSATSINMLFETNVAEYSSVQLGMALTGGKTYHLSCNFTKQTSGSGDAIYWGFTVADGSYNDLEYVDIADDTSSDTISINFTLPSSQSSIIIIVQGWGETTLSYEFDFTNIVLTEA